MKQTDNNINSDFQYSQRHTSKANQPEHFERGLGGERFSRETPQRERNGEVGGDEMYEKFGHFKQSKSEISREDVWTRLQQGRIES